MTTSRAATYQDQPAVIPALGRKPVDMTAGLLMTLFCLALGLQQVAIKAVAVDISPLAQIALRSMMAAVLVGVLVRWRGVRLSDLRAQLGAGILVGLGFTFEFVFVAWGLNYTLASHMSVFLYTAPVFAALGLHWLVPGEQLARHQWWGIGTAFIGMVFAMAPTTEVANAGNILIGDLLGLLAGLSWAATTLVLRRTSLSEAPAEQTLVYQLLTATLLLVPAAYVLGDLSSVSFTNSAIASLTFQTLVISFGALLLWFALLRRYWASQLGVFSFLSPIFGVLFGAVLLDEPLTTNFVIGGVIILSGIILVTRQR
ncbi:DMT family transporter [Marinobacter sp. NFXS9]|uniref:DMT family transporter n=1 Tax=Marinobacter sp. NFXS9 TaxID=2818433 RepID=UPI0032DFE19A